MCSAYPDTGTRTSKDIFYLLAIGEPAHVEGMLRIKPGSIVQPAISTPLLWSRNMSIRVKKRIQDLSFLFLNMGLFALVSGLSVSALLGTLFALVSGLSVSALLGTLTWVFSSWILDCLRLWAVWASVRCRGLSPEFSLPEYWIVCVGDLFERQCVVGDSHLSFLFLNIGLFALVRCLSVSALSGTLTWVFSSWILDCLRW